MTQQTDSPTRITIGEAARIWGVSKDTVRRRISAGEISYVRIGKGRTAPIRLRLDEVEAYARPGTSSKFRASA